MNVLIRNGLVVTQDEGRHVLEGNVFVEDGVITEVGHSRDKSDYVLDANGGIVMPGLINTHTHVAMTGLRGLLDDMNLGRFLERTFELDAHRTETDIRQSTELSIAEMVSGGTTSFADLYYSEDIIAEVCRRWGIRCFLAWVTLDRDITTQSGDPVRNAETFARHFAGDKLVTPMIGMQGVYACSEETVASARDVALKLEARMHMHLCETRHEVYDHLKKTGSRPVEWLKRAGILDGSVNLLAAHGAWLTKDEMKTLRSAGASVSTCARSNMKLGSGIAPVHELLESGVCVSFGTDSATTSNNLDMFEEMRTASLLQKVNKWDASILPASQVLDMATRGAAVSLGMQDRIGSIEKGKLADIAVLDRYAARLAPLGRENVLNQIVYSAQAADVLHTIVGGTPLYVNRSMTRQSGN